jgi:hypothetical protein
LILAKQIIFVLLVIVLAAAVYLLPPIPQDTAYHAFADNRTLFGIPNCLNVISNTAFLLVGGAGLIYLATGIPPGGMPEFMTAYRVFFAGMLLVGIGSAYYHLAPDNGTLVWDRLPMTLSFMAFFSVLIGERVSVNSGVRLLWPLLLAGVVSVLYWWLTEERGSGDLRLYILVQFLPMVAMPLLLLFYKSPFGGDGWIWLVFVAYAVSKLAELGDEFLFELTGLVSGHTLKHVLAVASGIFFLCALHYRRRQ